jgi:ADP-ribose pyrophosphatase
MSREWEVLRREPCFEGFFTLNRYRLKHELFNGGWSAPIEREVLERGHAAAVLPYDPALDKVLLIEQFRPGALGNAGGPWLIEFIAGIVEPGETDEDVVRREAVEEAGIELQTISPLTTFYPSPGGCSETIALLWATADLANAGGVYGLADEGEDIRATVHGFDDAMQMVERGEINNAATIILMLWFGKIRQQQFGR